MNKKLIAVDFDGTCVTHEYPHIGEDIGAFQWLRKIQEQAHIILWTMRSGKELQDAVDVMKANGINLFGINAYANLYVDDAAFGCPLILSIDKRPFVNWDIAGPQICKSLGIQI